jgi:hypothetical protein
MTTRYGLFSPPQVGVLLIAFLGRSGALVAPFSQGSFGVTPEF